MVHAWNKNIEHPLKFLEWWVPSPAMMHKAGIEFVITDQFPGDLISGGPACLHFVLNPVSSFVCFLMPNSLS
jgi:hypothetical protein